MSQYKPGPAKTKGGFDVVIFEVSERIYGKIHRKETNSWHPMNWEVDGTIEWKDDHLPSTLDLAPVEKPKRRFEAFVNDEGALVIIEINTKAHSWAVSNPFYQRLPEKDFEIE